MMILDTSILGQEVPLKDVDKAVRALWADESAGKTRASLMNFAIYSEDPLTLERNTHLLSEITREHSCRALLILNEPGESEHLTRAWVTAHCQLSNGKSSVCCEQLSFVIQGGHADSVRNVMFSHVESDLPLVVWWQGELTERLDERLYSVLDGLIIDSSKWAEPGKNLRTLMAARGSRTARFTLGDLSWMRSHVIRLSLAAAFQNAALLAALPQMNSLRVVHAKGSRAGALLLAAWVGTQLSAKLGSTDGRMYFLRPHGSEIAVLLEEGAEAGCTLQSLQLCGPNVSVLVSREGDSGFVHAVSENCGRAREDMQPALRDSDADLIVDQLSRFGGTTRYYEALPLFMEMADAIG